SSRPDMIHLLRDREARVWGVSDKLFPNAGSLLPNPVSTRRPKGGRGFRPRPAATRNAPCRPQHPRLGAGEKPLSARPFSARQRGTSVAIVAAVMRSKRHATIAAVLLIVVAGLCPHAGMAAESQRDSAETAFRDAREYTVRIRTQIVTPFVEDE